MISLFAFILVLGIVVDDAIVTGENVYHRIQKGEHPSVAAWKGTSEVGTIVVFGVLTTMVAFTPMLGLSGVSGKSAEHSAGGDSDAGVFVASIEICSPCALGITCADGSGEEGECVVPDAA